MRLARPSCVQATNHSRAAAAGPLALFIRLIICTFQLVFSVGTVFFSHNKSANSIFQPAYQRSRTGSLPLEPAYQSHPKHRPVEVALMRARTYSYTPCFSVLATWSWYTLTNPNELGDHRPVQHRMHTQLCLLVQLRTCVHGDDSSQE
jgi:hypothetical protein